MKYIDVEPSVWQRRLTGEYTTHFTNYVIPPNCHVLTRGEFAQIFEDIMKIRDGDERRRAFKKRRKEFWLTGNYYRTGDLTLDIHHDRRMLCLYESSYQFLEMNSGSNYGLMKVAFDLPTLFL